MTAPWSTSGPLNRLKTIVDGLAGVQWSQLGIPPSVPKQVGAYITIGGQSAVNKTTGGQIQRTMSYHIAFAYATDGAADDAETAIAALIDLFFSAVLSDQTLANTLEALQIDSISADNPQYTLAAGEEIRQYPIRVMGQQRKTYPV